MSEHYWSKAYSFARDLAERAVWTFLQSFAATAAMDYFVIGVEQGQFNLGLLRTAALAGIASVLSMLKSLIASKQGSGDAALPSPVEKA